MHAFTNPSPTTGARHQWDPRRRGHCDLGPALRCRYRTSFKFAYVSNQQRSSPLIFKVQQSGASEQQGAANDQQQPTQKELPQDGVQQLEEDPVEAMLYVAQQEMGMNVVWADPNEAEEDWDDALEDLEDAWMRNPASPEWAEAPGMGFSSDSGGGSSSSNTGSSVQSTSRSISTITWQQLQQQQQQLVILQLAADGTSPARQLPDPLPWSSAEGQDGQQVQHITLQLTDLTKDAAEAWQDKTVAVLDTGHHSCLGAAIRLSAVYRMANVFLLQLDQGS